MNEVTPRIYKEGKSSWDGTKLVPGEWNTVGRFVLLMWI